MRLFWLILGLPLAVMLAAPVSAQQGGKRDLVARSAPSLTPRKAEGDVRKRDCPGGLAKEAVMEEQVARRRTEMLVILDGERAAETLDDIRRRHRVTHVASPRVVVVESGPAEAARLPSIPGVKVATAGEVPPNALKGLDDSETVFVQAWGRRIKEVDSKRRRGEGLSWDAPGFEPPDPPLGSSDPGRGE